MDKKKALLVAVGNPGVKSPLESPQKDIALWRTVLERYGFTDIVQRVEDQAKRATVVKDIAWLVSDVDENDQIVFVFLGHGRLVDAHEGASENYEEALIVYPDDPGDLSLRSAEITDSDVTRIIVEQGMKKGVDAAIVLDTCFAGYFDVPVPPDALPLFIPPAHRGELVIENVREFGSFGQSSDRRPREGALVRVDAVERPIVLAACGRTEAAYEVRIDGIPYMLFTLRATRYILDALDQGADVTSQMVVDDIYPLVEGYPQRPRVRGNVLRAAENFPGQAGFQPLRFADAATTRTLAPTPLNIRVEGIACYAAARRETDPYRKRLLFPHDTRTDPNVKHITFIEIPRDHVESFSGTSPKEVPHVDDPTNYYRWELRGHVISVPNADDTRPLTVTAGFANHVPKMTKVHPPFATQQYHPRAECFTADPGAALLDAYFDLKAGTLRVGELDPVATVFQPDSGPPPTAILITSPFTTLELPLTAPVARILVTPFGSGSPAAEIQVKPGGKVRIGNSREGDIVGSGTSEQPREHFRLYYRLADAEPVNPALPLNSGVPEMFCPPTGWP